MIIAMSLRPVFMQKTGDGDDRVVYPDMNSKIVVAVPEGEVAGQDVIESIALMMEDAALASVEILDFKIKHPAAYVEAMTEATNLALHSGPDSAWGHFVSDGVNGERFGPALMHVLRVVREHKDVMEQRALSAPSVA